MSQGLLQVHGNMIAPRIHRRGFVKFDYCVVTEPGIQAIAGTKEEPMDSLLQKH